MKVVVGQGSCGSANGAKKTSNEFERLVAEKNLTNVVIDKTGCIGTCYLEPIVDVYKDNGELEARYVKLQPEKVAEVVEKHLIGGEPVAEYTISEEDKTFLSQQRRLVLRNCGLINPEKIDEYIVKGGYEAAKKVITTMTQDEVIEVVKVSGLRGRGGAGFPTWFKWNAIKSNAGAQKYMVCNADEGDPGAFMDRSVLEGDPHCVLEAMAIAGYAIGATKGYIYVRAEYPIAVKRLEIAIGQAREYGLLGKNIFDSGFDFEDVKAVFEDMLTGLFGHEFGGADAYGDVILDTVGIAAKEFVNGLSHEFSHKIVHGEIDSTFGGTVSVDAGVH